MNKIARAAEIAEEMLSQDLRRGVWTPCSMVALGALREALGKHKPGVQAAWGPALKDDPRAD